MDLTGAYDATDNPTGWGSPNADIADYHYAKIEFFLNGTLVQSFDFDNTTFPTTDIDFTYNLPAALADGVYTIVYTVQEDNGTGNMVNKTIYQSFYCNVECCVMSMLSSIDVECDCSNDMIDKFNQAYALLKGLKYASGCGNVTNFNNILAQLQKLCKNSNCQNCK